MYTLITALALNTKGIQEWLQTNIVPLLLAVIGIAILARSRKGNWSDTMNTTGIAIIGIIFIVGAAGFMTFGEDMSNLIFN